MRDLGLDAGGQAREAGRLATCFVLALAVVVVSCASTEPGRYGVQSLEIRGAEEMDEESLSTCLVTRERARASVRLGVSSPECGEPPFDRSSPEIRLWRWPWTEWPAFNQAVFDQDLERVLRWYRARGFYDAKISKVELDPAEAAEPGAVGDCDPETEKCKVAIVVTVEEGLPVLVTRVEMLGLDALPEPVRRSAARSTVLESKRRFDEAEYDRGKRRIEDALRDAGYAAAKVDGVVEIDTTARTATVEYRVTPGPTYRFGRLTVEGADGLPLEKIARAAALPTGRDFDPEVLREIQAEVFALGAFSAVEVVEKLDEASHEVDVVVKVTPLAPQQLRVGLGVLSGASRRTDTGELESIPQWDLHLFGTYERRHLAGSLARLRVEERPRMIFNRQFPSASPPQFGNVLSANLHLPALVEPRTNNFTSTQWDFGPDAFLGFRRSDVLFRVGARRGFWRRRVVATLALQQDLFVVPTARNSTSDGSPLPVSYRYAFVEQDVRLDLRDDRVRASKGAYFAVNATQGGRWQASDFTAFRVGPEARAYIPLPFDMVIASRFAVAAFFVTDASARIDALSQQLGPSSYRLRGGGANGNRGFFPGELGAGPQGGVRRWLSTLELRVPFGSSLAMVGFLDAGDVNDARRFRFNHLNTSVGFGFWYYTIVGAIRLDAGFRIPAWQRADGSDGIDPDASTFPFTEAPGALHLTIGESF